MALRFPKISLQLRIALALGSIYLIWGSTYLAIRFAIETLPPFLMAGTRFLVAGLLIYGWMRLKGTPAPKLHQWKEAGLIGTMLLFGGNGGVVWAEQRVPTGIASLLIATEPLWIVFLEWLRRGGAHVSKGVILGVVLGFAGVVILVYPSGPSTDGMVDPAGALALLLSALAWATGSLYSRAADLPDSPFLTTGMEMLCGGTVLLFAGFIMGEYGQIHWEGISLLSGLSLAYLIVFGSIVGFSAYIWLLKVTTPSKASTYAFVNPLVAVILGWAFANEEITPKVALSAGVILSAVVLLTKNQKRDGDRPINPEQPVKP